MVNTLEDRLRAAMHAAGETVTADSAPPLRLPPQPAPRRAGSPARPARWRGWSRRRRWSGRPRWHGWSGWLAPVAAAVAVAATVTAAQALPQLVVRVGQGRPQAWAATVPPYYVVLTYSNPAALGPKGDALVRATATGRMLATVTPPAHGTFTAVTAGADNHTFVLAAQMPLAHGGAADRFRLFQLSVGQPRAGAWLTALPVAVKQANATLTGLALSPDGAELAIALTLGYRSQIRVVSMATGRSRTWSGLTPVPRSEAAVGVNWIDNLSWAADGRTLAYENVYNVRLLDTLAAGRSLKLDSVKGKPAAYMAAAGGGKRVTLTCAAPRGYSLPGYYGNAMLTPDGNLVVATGGFRPGKSAIANIPRARWQGGTLTYPCSAGSRRILRSSLQSIRYGKLTGSARWIYWAGAGGRSLIVVARFGLGGRGLVGVLRGGRFTPLPGTARIPVAPDPPETPVAW